MTAPLKINVHLWGTNIGQLTWDEYARVATFQFSEDYFKQPYNLLPTKPVKPLASWPATPTTTTRTFRF